MSAVAQPGVTYRLRCLGPAMVTGPDDERVSFENRKQVVLLYYLARHPGRPVSRDELTEVFWHGDEEKKARHSLSHAVSLINKSLKIEAIVPAGASRVMLVENIVWSDVREFERLAADGEFMQARDLWSGTLFEGYWISKAPKVEEWIATERSRVERTYRRVLHELIDEFRTTGDHDLMRKEAEALLQVDELDERAMLAYVEALTLLGDRTLALREYQAFETKLSKELSAEPSSKLKSWAKRQRSGLQPSNTVPSRIENDPIPIAQPMYGRDEEFSLLWEAWERAKDGRGSLVVVQGVAGIGKTTLMAKLANQAHVAGGSVCFIKCFRSEKAIPFAPVASLVRQLSRLPGFVGVAGTWLGELTRLAPEIRDRFSGLPMPMAIDDSSRHRLSDAVAQATEAVTEEQPLIIVVDDLQDADEATIALLHYLGRQSAQLALLMVLGHRTGTELSEVEKTFLKSATTSAGRALELHGLNAQSVERLIRQTLAREGREGSDQFISGIVNRACGNPLHAIEAAIALPAAPGAASSRNTPDPQYSSDFQGMAAERLLRLPSEAQRVAKALAVAERTLSEYELSQVVELAPVSMARALETLQQASFTRVFGRDIGLAHDRYAAAVLQNTGKQEAVGLHQKIAELLAQSAAANGSAHYEVARHFQMAGKARSAAAHARKAARFAESIGATREKAAALELLMAVNRPSYELLAQLGECYLDLNDLEKLTQLCEQGRSSCEQSEQVRAEIAYLEAAAATHGFSEPLPEIERKLAQIVQEAEFIHKRDAQLLLVLIADKTGNYSLVRQTSRSMRKGLSHRQWSEHIPFVIGYVFAKYYWPAKAIPFFERALEMCHASKNWTLEQFARECLAICTKLVGRFAESISHYQDSLALARKVMNPQAEARSLQNRAVSEMALGEFETAWATLEETRAQEMSAISHDYTSYNQGVILFHQGEFSKAQQLFLITFGRAWKSNHSLLASDACAFAAICAQRLGDIDQVRQLTEKLRSVEPSRRDLRLGFASQVVAAWRKVLQDNRPEEGIRLLQKRARELSRRDVALWLATEQEIIVLKEAILKTRATTDRTYLEGLARSYGMKGVIRFCQA